MKVRWSSTLCSPFYQPASKPVVLLSKTGLSETPQGSAGSVRVSKGSKGRINLLCAVVLGSRVSSTWIPKWASVSTQQYQYGGRQVRGRSYDARSVLGPLGLRVGFTGLMHLSWVVLARQAGKQESFWLAFGSQLFNFNSAPASARSQGQDPGWPDPWKKTPDCPLLLLRSIVLLLCAWLLSFSTRPCCFSRKLCPLSAR
ncbi:hypothetical protein NDU88_005271 [Pleurodeles waltl]|uniref:Uncharacterized protein n=1 Tax=Pleurodeles waltl TaxID=8319 RepID=A0AAV7VL16_PLEWA|nr:hypothetical protein NDU88_005271 [Pleurodeles waltl]